MPVNRSWGVLVEPGRLDAYRMALLPAMPRNVLSRYVTRSRHPSPMWTTAATPGGLVPSSTHVHAYYGTSTRARMNDMGRGRVKVRGIYRGNRLYSLRVTLTHKTLCAHVRERAGDLMCIVCAAVALRLH